MTSSLLYEGTKKMYNDVDKALKLIDSANNSFIRAVVMNTALKKINHTGAYMLNAYSNLNDLEIKIGDIRDYVLKAYDLVCKFFSNSDYTSYSILNHFPYITYSKLGNNLERFIISFDFTFTYNMVKYEGNIVINNGSTPYNILVTFTYKKNNSESSMEYITSFIKEFDADYRFELKDEYFDDSHEYPNHINTLMINRYLPLVVYDFYGSFILRTSKMCIDSVMNGKWGENSNE